MSLRGALELTKEKELHKPAINQRFNSGLLVILTGIAVLCITMRYAEEWWLFGAMLLFSLIIVALGAARIFSAVVRYGQAQAIITRNKLRDDLVSHADWIARRGTS